MTRFLHLRRWLSLVPAASLLAGAFVLAGCDSGPSIEETPAVHPDVTSSQDAMLEYQKTNPKFGKPGAPNK